MKDKKSPGKIIFYINVLCKGGAERVILQLARRFSCEGYKSIIVTSFEAKDEYEVPEGVERISMEKEETPRSRLKKNIFRIKALREICKREKPDLLISFMQEPNFRAILATLGLPVKTLVSVRNDPSREYAGKVGKIVGKFILPMADGCVFQTSDAQAWFPKRLQKKSAIIMNEVSETFFNVTRENTSNIVTVGRLSEQKNHKMLIRAFGSIASKHPDQNLLIYGEGNARHELEQLIESLNLDERVMLMGNTSDVPGVLSKASIFVLSSDYEGMPNALLEALAVGVPSVSTDCPCGGPKSIIEHGANGLLVPVGNQAAIADAMDKLLSDNNFAQKIGFMAKERASLYAPDKIFDMWKTFAEGIMYEY